MLKNDKKTGCKKTKVGWIPEEWECVPFGSVFDLAMVPLTPTPSLKYREIGVRSHGKGIFHKPPVTGESLGDKRVFHCQPGTLVFNIVFAWEQAVAVISDNEKGFIASHRFPMFQGKNNQASEAYYLLFFKTRRGKEQLEIASPGGAGRNKTLGQADLKVLPVPCPPFPEQIAIAEVLECWDKGIRTLEKKIEKKRLVKNGLMQKLLSGETRLRGFSGLWKKVRLGKVFNLIATYAFSREKLTTEDVDNCDIYNIHYGDIHATYMGAILDLCKERRVPMLITSDALPSKMEFLKDGDLIMADVSEDYEGIGACFELKNIGARKVTGGLHTFVLRDAAEQTAEGFRGYLFREYGVAKELKRIATGVSVYSLSKSKLIEVNLHLPPLDEQRAIAKVLSAADAEIEALERKLALLKDQKRFLLNNLVTGALRLPKFRQKEECHA